jgi:large repetitive protein
MKFIALKNIGLLFLSLISSFMYYGQCTNSNAYGTYNAPTGTGTVTFNTLTWQTEYTTVNNVVAGMTYTNTYSLGGCITVHSGTPGGPVVAHGNSPLTWTATTTGTHYIHYNTSCSTCGTATSSGTVTMTCNSCLAGCTNTSAFGSATPAQYNFPVTISTCNFQGEYSLLSNLVAGNTYQISNSCGGFVTIHANTFNGPITASGNAPLSFTPSASGNYFVHYNTNSSCGTSSAACCLTTLTCTSCPAPPPPVSCGDNPAAGNTCGTATPICDLDGYCGNTSASYGSNYWSQLGSAFCGSIENNSFISFVASASTVTLDVWVLNSNTAGLGVQMFFFRDDCSGSLSAVHECYNHLSPGGPYTLTATGLTPGLVYTLMIDGYAGAVADYVISANTGVQLPVIASDDVAICVGQSTNLSAIGGNGSYTWSPSTGLSATTGANVVASPTVTTTYTATSATGNVLCPSSTSDQVTVTVNSGTPLSLTGTSPLSGTVGPAQSISLNICSGGSATISTTGGSTYSWTPTTGLSCSNCANPTASPTATTTYTVTSTNASGCPSTGTVTVNVVPPPTLTVNSGTICSGSSMVLTASGANSYSWSPSTGLSATTGASVTASPSVTTSYTVTGSNPGCPNTTATATVTVTQRPTPNFTAAGNFCAGSASVNFTNTSTNTTGGTTYAWTFTGGTPATSTAANPTGVTWGTAGTYNVTLTATTSGCSNSVTIPITINPVPTVTITPTQPLCNGNNGSVVASASTTGTFSWSSGQTGAGPHSVPAGSYTVTFTASNGCTATATTTINNPTPVAVTASGTNPTCFGTCNGTLNAGNATGGTGTYTYSWNSGLGAGQSKTGVCAGTYTVTATDGNGCPATANVTITAPPQITIATTQTNVSCNGGTNGTINVNPSGGTGTYTYAWTGGLTGQNPTNVAAGTYTVTVSSPAGCSQTANVTITQPTALTVTATGTNVSCNGASTGSASASASGGTGAVTYTWSNGGTGATITGLAAGTYTVTATDANSCTATASYTVTQPTALTVNMTNTPATCNGLCTGSATAAPAGGTAPYTYLWNAAGNLATTPTSTGLCAVPVSVTITDALGCTVVGNTTVTQPTALAVTATGTNPTCFGVCDGVVTANNATGGTAPYTYAWSGGLGAGQSVSGACGGAYTVTATDFNGCTATGPVTITTPPQITISTTTTPVSCNGGSTGSITVTPAGGTGTYTYAWTGGLTGQNPTNVAAGTYTVTVSSPAGCSQTANVTVTQPTALTVTATGTNVSCNGASTGSASASASGGTGAVAYTWSNGGTGATITGLAAGTYTVTATDANSCTATASYTVTQPTALTVNMTNTPATCNGLCNGSATAAPAGGTSPYTYVWNAAGNLATTATASTLCAGSPSVTVTDALGCTVVGNTTVTQPTVLAVTGTGTNPTCFGVCDGVLAANNATGGTAPYTYAWSGGLGAGQSVSGACGGTYTVTVTDANNCTATGNVTITTPPQITISTSTTPVSCNGGSNGSITVTPAGGTGTYTYAWTGGLTGQNPTNVAAGTYTVTVSSPAGCSQTANVTVTQPTALTVTATGTNVSCNGGSNGSLSATATGGTGAVTYTWNNGIGAGSNHTGVAANTYTVTATDANGCTATSSYTITQPAALTVAMSNTPATCNGLCTGSATAAPSGGTSPYTYQWNAAGNLATTATVNNVCAGAPQVTVTDALGCTTVGNTTVTEPTAIAITTSTTQSTCGNADGEACATVSGGTGPYTQSWSPGGQTTLCASNILAGAYTITVTDANSCVQTATANVTDAGSPTATITASSNVSCNGGNDGSATVSAAGGTAPYNYLWNGGTTPTATTTGGLSVGTASVIVTDANNCQASASVVITQPTALTAAITASTNVSCFGGNNGSATVTANGGTAPYTYAWNNSPSTTETATGLSAGVAQTVTITDALNCQVTATITLTQPTALSASITPTAALCFGDCNGSADLTATGGTAPYTYAWNDPANSTSQDVAGLCVGDFDVIVTDALGCQFTASTTINQPTAIAINTSSTQSTVVILMVKLVQLFPEVQDLTLNRGLLVDKLPCVLQIY